MAKRFPEVQVIAEVGSCLYGALNSARHMPRSTGLITWINDDDLLDAVGVRLACGRLATDASVSVVYGRVELIDAAGACLGELPVARRAGDLPALIAAGIMPLAQPGTVIRREALDALNWFDPSYRLAGDLDLFVRALKVGVAFAYVDVKLAEFRLHAGQLSKNEREAAGEQARAIAGWRPARLGWALWRFRWDNRWVYLARIRRHGFRRMKTLYRYGG